MVRKWPTPAFRARASTPSSSGANSGKSRWQWLSTSMTNPGRPLSRFQAPATGLQRVVPFGVGDLAGGRENGLARFQMQARGAVEQGVDLFPERDGAFIAAAVLGA